MVIDLAFKKYLYSRTILDPISIFHNLISPSSWPVINKCDYSKKDMQFISLFELDSNTVITVIS